MEIQSFHSGGGGGGGGACPQSAGFPGSSPSPKKLSDKMLYLTNAMNWIGKSTITLMQGMNPKTWVLKYFHTHLMFKQNISKYKWIITECKLH